MLMILHRLGSSHRKQCRTKSEWAMIDWISKSGKAFTVKVHWSLSCLDVTKRLTSEKLQRSVTSVEVPIENLRWPKSCRIIMTGYFHEEWRKWRTFNRRNFQIQLLSWQSDKLYSRQNSLWISQTDWKKPAQFPIRAIPKYFWTYFSGKWKLVFG